MTTPLDFTLRTRIVFGPGTVDRLGELVREYGGTRVMLVSDPGIVAAGHAARGIESIRRAGVEVSLFDGVCENPTTREVAAGLAFAAEHKPDFLVGLGGGSSMDCAKGVNFLHTNGGRMADYWGVGKAAKPMLPMIAVPTTAGTGSEAQSFALISDEHTHAKMACGDKKAACRAAVLDPALTLTCPARVTAVVGIDAVSHALESFVSTPANTLSRTFAREAYRLMREALPAVMADPGDLSARGAMLLGAHLAGASIEASMLGIAHSLANPLTAGFGVTHGVAIGLVLPHVLRFNAAAADPLYGELVPETRTEKSAGASLAAAVEAMRSAARLPARLRDCEVPADALPKLAAEAAKQWTARFNPRPVTEADLLELYRCAL
jgi:alcohol dehydrogenase